MKSVPHTRQLQRRNPPNPPPPPLQTQHLEQQRQLRRAPPRSPIHRRALPIPLPPTPKTMAKSSLRPHHHRRPLRLDKMGRLPPRLRRRLHHDPKRQHSAPLPNHRTSKQHARRSQSPLLPHIPHKRTVQNPNRPTTPVTPNTNITLDITRSKFRVSKPTTSMARIYRISPLPPSTGRNQPLAPNTKPHVAKTPHLIPHATRSQIDLSRRRRRPRNRRTRFPPRTHMRNLLPRPKPRNSNRIRHPSPILRRRRRHRFRSNGYYKSIRSNSVRLYILFYLSSSTHRQRRRRRLDLSPMRRNNQRMQTLVRRHFRTRASAIQQYW